MVAASALDHIVLIVTDVEAALDWYQRHAGLGPINVDAWRADDVSFPSLRVAETTIIDFVEGTPGDNRGHLDHICFVVDANDLATIAADEDLEVVDQGERSGARGLGQSVYVRGPDGLLVEFRSYPVA